MKFIPKKLKHSKQISISNSIKLIGTYLHSVKKGQQFSNVFPEILDADSWKNFFRENLEIPIVDIITAIYNQYFQSILKNRSIQKLIAIIKFG